MSGKIKFSLSPETYVFLGFLIPPAVMLMLVHWFWSISSFVPVYYLFNPGGAEYLLEAMVLSVLVSCLLFFRKKLELAGRVFYPALLFYPLCALPYNFLALAGTFAVFGWCVYRLPCRELKVGISERSGWIMACLCSVIAGGWSFLLQRNAYLAQWLTADWWIYMKSYYHLAFEPHDPAEFLIQGGHANLLPNAVMTFLVRIFSDVRVVFAVSAVLIGLLPVCVYRLCRVLRLPAAVSLLFAVLTMLNPILINQSLSLFYGYHPVLFFGPLLVVFFIFREKKNMAGMIAVAALSMLVQETVFIFWAGYALYLVREKKYFRSAALFIFCTAAFLGISYILMPTLCGTGSNTQMFHYAKLGSTPAEVLLSPFLRPAAFWEVVSAPANFYFLLAVLMPCGVLALRQPSMLLIILPLLAGVLLQESPDLKNPAMQYGYEFTVLLIVMSAISAGHLYGEKRFAVLRCSIFTALAMTLLCALYYGQIPFSRCSVSGFFRGVNFQDFHDTVMEKVVPGNGRVITSELMRPYYLFNRKTAPFQAELQPGDYVILDMNTAFDEVEPVRRRLLANPCAVPVFATEFGYSHIVIWAVMPNAQSRPVFMEQMTADAFAALGKEADTGNRDFSLIVTQAQNGAATVHCRVNRPVNYDVGIFFQDGMRSKRALFGNGIYPAWHVKPGTVFTVVFPGPFTEKCSVSLVKYVENSSK